MNKDIIKKLALNSNNIPGIFNYCDRWCERCSFTSRCLNYKINDHDIEYPINQALNNKKFEDKLSKIFQVTIEMLKDLAKELGIDLNGINDNNKVSNLKNIENAIDKNPIISQAFDYIEIVNKWFKNSEQLFEQKQKELILEVEIDLPNSHPYDDVLTITDAVEVIRWYQNQIYVKLKRAFYSSIWAEDVNFDNIPKDSDGSAKVALIGIDRSIAAWGKLQNIFFENEDEILGILVHLFKLRNNVETKFPNARYFKRIGFYD